MPTVYHEPNHHLNQKEQKSQLPPILNAKLIKLLILFPAFFPKLPLRPMRQEVFAGKINHRYHKNGSDDGDDDES